MPIKTPIMTGNFPAIKPVFHNRAPVALTSTSAQSAIINCGAVRIAPDVDAHFKIGKDPVATTNDPVIFAGDTEIYMLDCGEKIALIKKTGQNDGYAWVHGCVEG